MNDIATENAWNWLIQNKGMLWDLLSYIPLRALIINIMVGTLAGLLIGVILSLVLQKYGLFTRKTKWLNIAVKIYWVFIPAIFVFCGAHLALIRSTWLTADGIVVAHESTIQNYTKTFLGEVQTRLDTLIEQSPSLKDASLNDLIDQAFSESAVAAQTESIAADSSTIDKMGHWLKQTTRSTYFRMTLKAGLTKAAQKVSKADKTTIEMAFSKTLGEMTEANIIYDFVRERLRRLMWSFVSAALLHSLLFLLIPATEIGLSKWQKW